MRYIMIIVFLGMVATAAEPEMRNWVMNDGSVKTRAIVKIEDNLIYWKDADGKESCFYLDRLSDKDREYIYNGNKPARNAFERLSDKERAAITSGKRPTTSESAAFDAKSGSGGKEMRLWKTAKGKEYYRAFVKLENGKVYWKAKGEDVKSIALEQLSQEDQDYVNEIIMAEDEDEESDEPDSQAQKKNAYLKANPEINRIYTDINMVCTHIAQTRTMYKEHRKRTQHLDRVHDYSQRQDNKKGVQDITAIERTKPGSISVSSSGTVTASGPEKTRADVQTKQEKAKNYRNTLQSAADIMFLLGDCRKRCQDFRAKYIEEPIQNDSDVQSGSIMIEWENLKRDIMGDCSTVRSKIK